MAYRPLRDLGDARTAWLRGREALTVIGSLHRDEKTSTQTHRTHNDIGRTATG